MDGRAAAFPLFLVHSHIFPELVRPVHLPWIASLWLLLIVLQKSARIISRSCLELPRSLARESKKSAAMPIPTSRTEKLNSN
jgi:hypothetical protein